VTNGFFQISCGPCLQERIITKSLAIFARQIVVFIVAALPLVKTLKTLHDQLEHCAEHKDIIKKLNR
jgi:type II secretory pathway component PulF